MWRVQKWSGFRSRIPNSNPVCYWLTHVNKGVITSFQTRTALCRVIGLALHHPAECLHLAQGCGRAWLDVKLCTKEQTPAWKPCVGFTREQQGSLGKKKTELGSSSGAGQSGWKLPTSSVDSLHPPLLQVPTVGPLTAALTCTEGH